MKLKNSSHLASVVQTLDSDILRIDHYPVGQVLGKLMIIVGDQGCALAEPGGPWHLTFALGRLGNLIFFIQIICWAP